MQDHKRAFVDDKGPNTGGMGVFAPSPKATRSVLEDAIKLVIEPTIAGLKAEKIPYKGVLYAGLILTDGCIKVLFFQFKINAHFLCSKFRTTTCTKILGY